MIDGTSSRESTPGATPLSLRLLTAALLVGVVSALFFSKWGGALRAVDKVSRTGDLGIAPSLLLDGGALTSTLHYFARVWPALVYGLLVGAIVRALVPARVIARFLGRKGFVGTMSGALAGSPLMLCSCCVTPVFTGVYERGARLGNALSLMLASPGLHVGAIALTFALFSPKVALLRLGAVLLAVLVLAPLVGARWEGSLPQGRGPGGAAASAPTPVTGGSFVSSFAKSLAYLSLVTVPLILAGVLLSALLLPYAPTLSSRGVVVSVLLVTTIATLVALPTFFEIPLALLLLRLGAPEAAAVVVLVAGPIVNLPSLLVLGRESSVRVALAMFAGVWTLAAGAGLLAAIGAPS